MRVAVLTYHSNNILSNDYAENDHVALASDLRTIRALNLPILPLREAVRVVFSGASAPERAVALSCDDGSWFDWHDLPHPTLGPQRSLRGVLEDFVADTGVAAHLTSFVIVSPQARAELDRTCLIGCGWWGHDWWSEAARSPHMAIASHSWDHNHDTLTHTAQRHGVRGTFRNIETEAEADAEIAQASDWLHAYLEERHCPLFAYPYGERSDYLVREYFPQHSARHRTEAAFTTEPEPLTASSSRWEIGRYVCGQHWRDPDGLRRLLREALG